MDPEASDETREMAEREARIQERRERIRQREYAKNHPEQVELVEDVNPFPENEQIGTSVDRVNRLREAGTELVSNVYVAAQAREFERRQEASEAKKSRIEKLQGKGLYPFPIVLEGHFVKRTIRLTSISSSPQYKASVLRSL